MHYDPEDEVKILYDVSVLVWCGDVNNKNEENKAFKRDIVSVNLLPLNSSHSKYI